MRPAPDVLTDTTLADTSPTSEAGVDAVPVLPLAAAVTDDGPRHGLDADGRSSSASASRSSWASCSPSASAPASCTHGTSSTTAGSCPASASAARNVGGLTREQAEAAIANAYGSLGDGQIKLTGPDGQTTTISYADVGRGPDTSALVDAALAAGRQGEPLADLIGGPQVAIHGMTLDSAVAYDRDKLAAAVDRLAAAIDRDPDGRLRVGRRRRVVQRLPGEGRARRRPGGPPDRARPAARARSTRRRRSRWPCRS